MSKLKPCPFCGGKAHIRKVKTKDVDKKLHPVFGNADKIYVVGCETWNCLLYLCDKSPSLSIRFTTDDLVEIDSQLSAITGHSKERRAEP